MSERVRLGIAFEACKGRIRPIRRRAWWLVLLGITGGASGVEASSCGPTFVQVSGSSIEFSEQGQIVGIRAALVGCREELDKIQGEDLSKVQDLLREVIREEDLDHLHLPANRGFRERTVARVNAVLEHGSASDIFIFAFGFAE